MDVAVKSLQSPDNPTDKESFEKEMAISADPKLDHPNIVKVYGLVEGGITNYIVIIASLYTHNFIFLQLIKLSCNFCHMET